MPAEALDLARFEKFGKSHLRSVAVVVCVGIGCGGGFEHGGRHDHSHYRNCELQATQQFTATVTGNSNNGRNLVRK